MSEMRRSDAFMRRNRATGSVYALMTPAHAGAKLNWIPKGDTR